MLKLPTTNLIGLPRPVSDHCPLLINSSLPIGGLTPFGFENMWIRHKDFKPNISSWWADNVPSRWAANKFHLKLKSIKVRVKLWNKEVFGIISVQKQNLIHDISLLDRKEFDRGLSIDEISCRRAKRGEL